MMGCGIGVWQIEIGSPILALQAGAKRTFLFGYHNRCLGQIEMSGFWPYTNVVSEGAGIVSYLLLNCLSNCRHSAV